MSDAVYSRELGEYVNMTEALGRLRGNKKIYKTLLGTFLKNDSMATLQDAVAKGDREAAAVAAHTIKGMAGNLSLTALYRCSMAQEALLKAGEDADITLLADVWEKTGEQVRVTIDEIEV